MTLVFRDLDGNIVTDAGTEPENSTATRTPAYTSDSTVPVNFDKYQGQEEPEPQTPEGSSYVDTDTTSTNQLGAGQGFLAGLEEINEFNPFGGVSLPAAAGLVAPFSDKTYSEIKDEMSRRQKERKDIGRATEGEGFRGVRETTQKVGNALKPIEEIMMGLSALNWAAKTNAGLATLQALGRVPGAKAAGTVLSKTIGSRNPLVRAGSLAGVAGAGTAAYDKAKGKNTASTATDAVLNALSIGLPVLGAGYLPAKLFYPAMATAGAVKGYAGRSLGGQGTDVSDVLGDVAGSVAYGRLLRGEVIPEDTAIEKGSKAAKAIDKFKTPNKESTGNIEQEADLYNYDKDTPVLKVPLKKAQDFFEHFRKIDPTKASDFARDVIRPMQKETGAKLKARLDKEFPKVKERTELQEAFSKPYRDRASAFDKAAVAGPDKRPIKVERVNKVLPEGSTYRHIQDDLYRDVKGPRGAEGEYNRYYYQKAREKASMLSENDPTMAKVAEKMRQVQAPQKTHKKAWKSADTKSHNLIITEENIAKAGTPENAAFKAKNTIWENENYHNQPTDKITYDKLGTIGLPNNPPLSAETSKLATEYDHLVNAEKVLNTPGASTKNLVAQAGAALPAGRLARYSVGTKLGERLLQGVGRLGTREAAETLSKLTVGQVRDLLRATWGSSVPLGEILSTVKNMPKVKKEESK